MVYGPSTINKPNMPKIAVFPKAFMNALCKDGTMRLDEWIDLAVKLDVQGLEWYAGFLEMQNKKNWGEFRKKVEGYGKSIPMMCCSPDFTHRDAAFRENEIQKQKHWRSEERRVGKEWRCWWSR